MVFGHELHLLDDIGQKFAEFNIFLMEYLPILVSACQEQELFDKLLHIFRFRTNGRYAFIQHSFVRTPPTGKQIRIAQDNRYRCAQLMRGIGHKTLLLFKAAFQSVQHMIEGFRKLGQFIPCRRNSNAPVHLLHFDFAGGRRHLTNGLQNTAAHKVTCHECQKEAQNGHQEQNLLQRFQKMLFRRNGLEKMHLVNLPAIFHVHAGMIERRIAQLGHLHILIGPEGRILYRIFFNPLNRRIMRIIFIDDFSPAVYNAQHHAGQDNIITAKIHINSAPLLHDFQHMVHADFQFHFGLMVKGKKHT